MASSKENQASSKESPKIKKNSGNADAKEEPLEISERKGPQAVDGKKNGKTAHANTIRPRKDGKHEEHESQDQEAPPEQPNVELLEPEELVPVNLLCPSCIEVSRRWPLPPCVDPNPKDPSLLYPGDEDPLFQPSRGDILVIHPGLHMGLADLHRKLPKDGFVSSYDGSPTFDFATGDLVLRMGTYDEKITTVGPTKKEISNLGKKDSPKKGEEKMGKLKGKKDKEKKGGSSKHGAGKKGETDEEKVVMDKPELCAYNPYEKLELYTCSGFITAEDEARLEAERLAIEAEKDKLENESKQTGTKGRKDKQTKENAKGNGKKKNQGGDDQQKGTEGNKDGKKRDPKVPALAKEEVEKKSRSQEEILVEPGDITKSQPKPKWRYLGTQMRLDTKSQSLLGKQCPGLTYFYRSYMTAGTRCAMHSLTPILGEIVINIGWLNNWYKNLEKWQKEVNNYKSLVRWFMPGLPSREELEPGMILLRPLVGREHVKWVGWGLDGKKLAPPLLPGPLIPQENDIARGDANKVEEEEEEEEEIVPPPKCDCHRKSPCPKPPCPCHLYDPCPKLPNCGCIYCNPLPRKHRQPHTPKAKDEEEIDGKSGKQKGKNKNENGKDGKVRKDEQPIKEVKMDQNHIKQQRNKGKSKDGKDSKVPPKNLEGKGKDGKDPKTKEQEGKGDPQEEIELPNKPYVWGAVEMYLFFGKEEGWEYWGRSERICDTPYPLPSENSKPKFLHLDDRLKGEETLEDKIGKENKETQAISKESAYEKPTEKSSKKGVNDDVNKKLQQEEIVNKKTKKT